MQRRITISEAQAWLPELAQYVAKFPDRVVLIDHPDMEEPFVFTTAAHLNFLTALVEELLKRLGEPFRLVGSIRSDLSSDQIEVDLGAAREKQRRFAESKFRGLAE